MWKLYLLLKPAIDNREREAIILDEIEKLLVLSKPGTLFECLSVLYDNISMDISGMQAVLMLVRGFEKNEFYMFVDIIVDIIRNNAK